MNLKNDITALKIIFQSKIRLISFILLSIIFAISYIILSGTYLIEYKTFNPYTTVPTTLFLILISIMTALLIVTFSYSTKIKPTSLTGFLGSILGFITTSCGCQSLWILALGLSVQTLNFLGEINSYIQIISIILLTYSLHVNLNNVVECKIKK